MKLSGTLLGIVALSLVSQVPAAAEQLSVMSFNVRYPAKSDGPDLWDLRKDYLVETVRKYAPDIMGTQELFKLQGDYIVEKIPEYTWFGVSRRGNTEDEHMGIFYKKDKLNLLDSGNYWLSETPERPNSQSWGASLPRMVTWGLFEIKTSGKKFLYLNTHFAHRREDETARQNSAKTIATRVEIHNPEMPVVLTGDFNAPTDGPAYQIIAKVMKDAWKDAAKREGPQGTFHGFRGKPGEARIDWIMYRAPWKVTEALTITDNRDGRYPSDHFPVLAIFEVN